jgi:hypothetical protein
LGASLRGANAPEVAPRIHEHINEDGPGDFDMIYSPSSSARLRIPVDRHFDDNFFKAVAATYSTLAALSPRPAAEIAEANKEALTTVHSWIKEARRRKFLAPGRKGKAG